MASYWHTPDPLPLEWLTVPQLIDELADKKPDDEAYVVRMDCAPREAITFLQLKTKTEALAEGLLKLGLKPGDFVLISGISCINWIITDLACATIGIRTIRCRISVLTKEGLLSITNHNNVKAIFYHPGENGEFEKHLLTCIPDAFSNSADQEILCQEIPHLKNVICNFIHVIMI